MTVYQVKGYVVDPCDEIKNFTDLQNRLSVKRGHKVFTELESASSCAVGSVSPETEPRPGEVPIREYARLFMNIPVGSRVMFIDRQTNIRRHGKLLADMYNGVYVIQTSSGTYQVPSENITGWVV